MADSDHRTITRNFPDGRRIIAVVTGPDDPTGDEEVLDWIEADMDRRQLRAVDDPE